MEPLSFNFRSLGTLISTVDLVGWCGSLIFCNSVCWVTLQCADSTLIPGFRKILHVLYIIDHYLKSFVQPKRKWGRVSLVWIPCLLAHFQVHQVHQVLYVLWNWQIDKRMNCSCIVFHSYLIYNNLVRKQKSYRLLFLSVGFSVIIHFKLSKA